MRGVQLFVGFFTFGQNKKRRVDFCIGIIRLASSTKTIRLGQPRDQFFQYAPLCFKQRAAGCRGTTRHLIQKQKWQTLSGGSLSFVSSVHRNVPSWLNPAF
jgi:hypothetical protein